jgi:acyl-CoA thioester hydrolase
VEGYAFSTPVRVRFADTDAQGIAHNSAFFVWFEVARVEYLRTYAGGYQALREQGIEALVLECFCRYLLPVRFDDALVVHTRCVDLSGARFRYEYAIAHDGAVVAEGWTAHACVDAATLRPVRLPEWLVDAVRSAESSSAASSARSR